MGLICTDGAPAMIRLQSGFVALMKQVAPRIVSNHCAIHKYALACRHSLFNWKLSWFCSKGCEFHSTLRDKFSILQSILRQPWKGASVAYLLFHAEVRWLSRGEVLFRVAELITEIAVFLREHGSVELATLFDDNRFQLMVFYLADIFSF